MGPLDGGGGPWFWARQFSARVGATSGIANTYGYGTKMVYDIGTS